MGCYKWHIKTADVMANEHSHGNKCGKAREYLIMILSMLPQVIVCQSMNGHSVWGHGTSWAQKRVESFNDFTSHKFLGREFHHLIAPFRIEACCLGIQNDESARMK